MATIPMKHKTMHKCLKKIKMKEEDAGRLEKVMKKQQVYSSFKS